jgi:hypothetical protein
VKLYTEPLPVKATTTGKQLPDTANEPRLTPDTGELKMADTTSEEEPKEEPEAAGPARDKTTRGKTYIHA